MRVVAAAAVVAVAVAAEVLEEHAICFNGCSGHGTCRDFMCTCDLGYVGDDCSHKLHDSTVPIFGGGHFNVTARNFSKTLARLPLVLVGFSSRSCHRCGAAEAAYADAAPALRALGVAFARADADDATLRAALAELPTATLPAVVAYRRGRAPRAYAGAHASRELIAYAAKLKARAPVPLAGLADVAAFLNIDVGAARAALAAEEGPRADAGGASRGDFSEIPASGAAVLGVFGDLDVEDDERADFLDVAAENRHRHDLYFAECSGATARALADAGVVDRTPGVVLARRADPDAARAAPLDALDGGLGDWVDAESLPAVGLLTNLNFARYEKLLRPMVLLFLDLTHHDEATAPFVGGKSGALFNEDLVGELRAVQRDESFRDRLAFAYLDGVAHADRARGLGLFGGAERLPALAVNTNERGVVAPFPERLPLERRAIREFCAAFLSKKLRSPADADAFALQKAAEIAAPDFAPRRKPRKKAPRETVGVSEQFGATSAGVARRGFADHVVVLGAANFTDVAIRDARDVLVLFHADGCEPCAHMAVYYKKLAERFHDMGVPSLVVARFDASAEAAPVDGLSTAGELPVLALFPAHEKRPPWRFYSGLAKVQPMMRWVADHADVAFDLPDLAHLSEADRVLYKEQVADRERARAAGEL